MARRPIAEITVNDVLEQAASDFITQNITATKGWSKQPADQNYIRVFSKEEESGREYDVKESVAINTGLRKAKETNKTTIIAPTDYHQPGFYYENCFDYISKDTADNDKLFLQNNGKY